MNTTNNPTTWRDLTDRLTAEQIESLEQMAQALGAVAELPQGQQAVLGQAQYLVELNTVAAEHADVPVPAGATVEGWCRNGSGGWFRLVEWAELTRPGDDVAGVAVIIDGQQHLDGTFERAVALYASDTRLTAEQARMLGALLFDAAEELEHLDAQLR